MRNTAQQYREYWATLTHENPSNIYTPVALREDDNDEYVPDATEFLSRVVAAQNARKVA